MSAAALLRYPTDGRRLPIFHGQLLLLLVVHLLLHLHQAIVILFKLLVLGETLLVVLHAHQVQRIDAGWEMAASQNSLVDGGRVAGRCERS